MVPAGHFPLHAQIDERAALHRDTDLPSLPSPAAQHRRARKGPRQT